MPPCNLEKSSYSHSSDCSPSLHLLQLPSPLLLKTPCWCPSLLNLKAIGGRDSSNQLRPVPAPASPKCPPLCHGTAPKRVGWTDGRTAAGRKPECGLQRFHGSTSKSPLLPPSTQSGQEGGGRREGAGDCPFPRGLTEPETQPTHPSPGPGHQLKHCQSAESAVSSRALSADPPPLAGLPTHAEPTVVTATLQAGASCTSPMCDSDLAATLNTP